MRCTIFRARFSITPALGLVTLTLMSLLACVSTVVAEPRSNPDLVRDRQSKPFEVMDFIGVQPGWIALDLFGGGGYYSEVLARHVGPTGLVYLHNDQATKVTPGQLQNRFGNISRRTGRSETLPNIMLIDGTINDLSIPSHSVDLVLLVQIYHDAYYRAHGWQLQSKALFKFIYRVLKPTGVLAVIDHTAVPGSGAEHAQALHRIDREFAINDISQHGFVLNDQSDLLENSDDDLQRSVFHPSIRGRTSRFLLTFRKTAAIKKGPKGPLL